jgi:hypothetical protein
LWQIQDSRSDTLLFPRVPYKKECLSINHIHAMSRALIKWEDSDLIFFSARNWPA